MIRYADAIFAPIDHDLELERIAGGNETEVYRTDDRRHVVKLKSDMGAMFIKGCSMNGGAMTMTGKPV